MNVTLIGFFLWLIYMSYTSLQSLSLCLCSRPLVFVSFLLHLEHVRRLIKESLVLESALYAMKRCTDWTHVLSMCHILCYKWSDGLHKPIRYTKLISNEDYFKWFINLLQTIGVKASEDKGQKRVIIILEANRVAFSQQFIALYSGRFPKSTENLIISRK